MSEDIISANEDTPLSELANILEKHRIKRVPILKDGKLVGIVSRSNLIQALASACFRLLSFLLPLPLVVAVTYLGIRTGDMLPENASALVGGAVIAVAVLLLRSKSEEARPESVVAITAHRVADLASALFSRFIVFIFQKTWGKP